MVVETGAETNLLAVEQALAVVSRHEAVCTHDDIEDT